jgi:hypothetical protein
MKAFLVVLACFMVCGCEDDNRTTITTNEAADDVVNIPTNGVATVATVNTTGDANTTIVYIQTLPGVTQVYDVNTGAHRMAPAAGASTVPPLVGHFRDREQRTERQGRV